MNIDTCSYVLNIVDRICHRILLYLLATAIIHLLLERLGIGAWLIEAAVLATYSIIAVLDINLCIRIQKKDE
jgi:hypothetical protein